MQHTPGTRRGDLRLTFALPGKTSGVLPFVVRLSGDLDIFRYPELREKLMAIPDSSDPVLVDISEADMVDSVCMRELLLGKRKLERDGRRVAVLVESTNVLRMLAIADVTEILNIFTERTKAIDWLERQD